MKKRDYGWLVSSPFFAVHILAVVGVAVLGWSWKGAALAIALYFVRMFGVTGGYHRYFSHRTYRTSRGFQFVLAVLAQSSLQKGALWWAAHHRIHHKNSDQPDDVHSPVQRGFIYSHFGWLFDGTEETRWDKIQDFAKYPELVWLNKNWIVPPVLLGAACTWFFGWPGLFIGFFGSTVLLWHNNHHHYQSSARNGFYWWEVDVTYYILKALSFVGIVWDLREPPARVLEEGRRLDRARREMAVLIAEPAHRAMTNDG
jgi:stearoyl-CoA desaturase (delta-9 desaturase)